MNDKTWYPYFKQTRRKHNSGYRMFEIGYIQNDGTKHIIGKCSDVVNIGGIGADDNVACSVDILDGGEIRILGKSRKSIKWQHEDWAISDAQLEYGEPNIK